MIENKGNPPRNDKDNSNDNSSESSPGGTKESGGSDENGEAESSAKPAPLRYVEAPLPKVNPWKKITLTTADSASTTATSQQCPAKKEQHSCATIDNTKTATSTEIIQSELENSTEASALAVPSQPDKITHAPSNDKNIKPSSNAGITLSAKTTSSQLHQKVLKVDSATGAAAPTSVGAGAGAIATPWRNASATTLADIVSASTQDSKVLCTYCIRTDKVSRGSEAVPNLQLF